MSPRLTPPPNVGNFQFVSNFARRLSSIYSIVSSVFFLLLLPLRSIPTRPPLTLINEMSTSNGSAASSFIIVDGADLRLSDASLPYHLSSLPSAVVAGSQVIGVAESRVRQFMYGYALPESLRSSALRRIGVSDVERFQQEEIEKDVAEKKVDEYVCSIADELEGISARMK